MYSFEESLLLSIGEVEAMPTIKVRDESRGWALAESCAKCHKEIYDECASDGKARHHFRANRVVSDEMDKRYFVPSQKLKHENSFYTFDKRGSNFRIGYKYGEEGKVWNFYPKMVIGVEPLYQYIYPLKGGRWQVTSMAIDTGRHEWFDVYPGEDRNPAEWGHWTMQGMNWNSNCAYCHTTWLEKNYDVKGNKYDTKWLDMGVSCVQCHNDLSDKCGEAYEKMGSKRRKLSKVESMEVCMTCHSRREEISANKFKPGDKFFDHFRIAVPDVLGVYYADGQILDEDFIATSFMLSRQYFRDITCFDCHDAHTLKTKLPIEKNELCMVCHADGINGASKIDPKGHSHHGNNEGNVCVECHMSKTVYMGRDARRDHGFISPDPILTKNLGIPNSCSKCHDKLDEGKEGRGLDWIVDNFKKWYGGGSERFRFKRARSYGVHLALNGEVDLRVKNSLLVSAKAEEISLWKSTLVTLLSTWVGEEDVFKFTKESLKDSHPMVRDAAIRSLAMRSEGVELARGMLKDENRLVRVDAAYICRGDNVLRAEQCYDELLEYLDFNVDRPIGALRRADAAVSMGRLTEARFYAKHAMVFEPENAELLRQIAIMLVRTGDSVSAYKLLEEAEAKSPTRPEFPYSIGLLYAENKEMKKAIEKLKKSVAIDPKFVAGWYNLALAYSQEKEYDKSLEAIDKAIGLEKSGRLIHVKGTIMYSMGMVNEAEKLFKEARGEATEKGPFQR